MKKIYALLIACSFYAPFAAQSPITLNPIHMPNSGDTLRYSNAQLSSVGNYTQTGANFNWDFSTLIYVNQGVRSFKHALQTPYGIFFLGLSEYGEKIADTIGAGPLTINDFYNFYKKQIVPAAYVADGAGMTFSSIPVPNYYSDKDELYHFPMTYPKYDSTTFKFSTPNTNIIPIVYSKSGYRVTKVDGWGTVTTPYITENCLRLVTTQYSKDSVTNIFFPFPLGVNNYQRSYQWLTSTSKIPLLEVTGSLVGTIFTPTQVRYRDDYRSTTVAPPPTATYTAIEELSNLSALQFYPNPVKDKLCIKNNQGRVVEICDLNGKKLDTGIAEIERDLQYIDVSAFVKGVYLIKVIENWHENYFKFIKE